MILKFHKILIILLLNIYITNIYSQTISIESFEEVPTDISASSIARIDGNHDICGLVKVFLTEKGAEFNGNIVGEVLYKVNQYWVYMSPGSKKLQIDVPGFPTLDVEFKNQGISAIQSKLTYKLVIKCKNDNSSIIVLDGNKLNEHEYIDLGLSVRWATCNIGACSPSEFGDYFAWGEIASKNYFDYISYFDSYLPEQDIYINYYTGGKNKIQPDGGNDVAREQWGSLWRMPSQKECEELCNKCTWKLSKKNGRKGYTVTGPNGNSIFLPFSGDIKNDFFRHYDDVKYRYEEGVYWTSDLPPFLGDDKALALRIIGNVSFIHEKDYLVGSAKRFCGASIRPVFDLKNEQEECSSKVDTDIDRTAFGYLYLDFSVKDLDIYINENLQNLDTRQIELPVGNYSLEIKKNGFKNVKKQIYIRHYKTTKIKDPLIEIEDIRSYEKALQLYNNKDYLSSFPILESLAKKGVPDAQYLLGKSYADGNGVDTNYEMAVYWYQMAANQGQGEAQRSLGNCYDIGRGVKHDEYKAASWTRKAAINGNADAQYNLAFLYTKGRGVDKNFGVAEFWYHKAAEQGHIKAKEKLGLSH